jgi:hypothetical protein
VYSPPRDPQHSIDLLRNAASGARHAKAELKREGLRPNWPPFWKDLPHTNIFSSFTPSLLHQLHKGVFKDHLFAWCREILGDKEMDARFQAMPKHASL